MTYVIRYLDYGDALVEEILVDGNTTLPQRGDVVELGPLLYEIHEVRPQTGEDQQLSLVEIDVDVV